jgi:hypothetical protein
LREQNGGYHRWAQHHQRLHFGLAENTLVDLRIEWPSGVVDHHFGVAAGSLYEVTEGDTIAAVQLGPVANDPGVVDPPIDPPATDSVDVERAVYLTQTNALWVRATTDAEPPEDAVLTAMATTDGVDEALGLLIWNANKQGHQRVFRNLSGIPDCITVTSSNGGIDSMAVERFGNCDTGGDSSTPSTIRVVQAIYVPETNVLWIQASSDVEPEGSDVIAAVMELDQVETPLGNLVWRHDKGFYQFTFKNIDTAPSSVIITNSSGGQHSLNVRIK